MARRLLIFGAMLAALVLGWPAEPARERRNFNDSWRFYKGDVKGAEQPAFNDNTWRKLNLPHDWSIEGPYSEKNASGTGFLPGGIGWYRKTFRLPESARGRKVFIEFDGVYRDSDVWINGRHLGHRPYGYSSFEYDLTPHIAFGAKDNVLAVRVDHSVMADSRWYPGSGIYRHVWLTTTQPIHVGHWGTYVRTPMVGELEALVSLETTVVNESKAAVTVRVAATIEDAAGRWAGKVETEQRVLPGASHTFAQQAPVAKPRLWSLEEPNLYTAVFRLYSNGALADEYRTTFGIRTIRFDPNRGFFLNGTPLKLKGVCIHHDLGALGAAFSEAALERRLKLLQSLGANAIRCSHNPMSPEFYDLCDRLGLLVMDEAFDEWTGGKRKWAEGWNVGTAGTAGYHEAFAQWAVRDLEDMVRRDRNHPSIVMWSIGNEIDYPGDPFTHPSGRNGAKPGTPSANELPVIARRLIAAVKALDATRPVTQALADAGASNATGLASMLDVTGYNYLEQFYEKDHASYPDRVILGSENSRNAAAWRAVASNDYVAGQFLWTGIDFLGESGRYPLRGSGSGLLDICGFRKPEAFLREALWSDRPMIYAAASEPPAPAAPGAAPPGRGRRLAENWFWAGDERKTVPVEVYTNCKSAELFLNGRSLGEKTVADRLAPVLSWDVPNEPGTLLAIGKREEQAAARFELKTAGKPDRLELLLDKPRLRAAGSDLANIEVRVVDSSGTRVYQAGNLVEFQVSGAGELVAVDSGDQRDISPVQSSSRKVFQGRALAMVRSARTLGKVTVRASAPGLKPAEATLPVD